MYDPKPADVTGIALPQGLEGLVELLAENAHDTWARQRIAQGWTWGPERDDAGKRHPDLVPYAQLSDAEREYDRRMAIDTIKLLIKLGYSVAKAGG
jgi:hypothetical protein